MATQKKIIGKLPVFRGEYNKGVVYYKHNIVTYLGSSFISTKDENMSVPCNVGDKEFILSSGWAFFSDSSEAYFMDERFDEMAEVVVTTDDEGEVNNVEPDVVNEAIRKTPQILSKAEQAQARANISAASLEENAAFKKEVTESNEAFKTEIDAKVSDIGSEVDNKLSKQYGNNIIDDKNVLVGYLLNKQNGEAYSVSDSTYIVSDFILLNGNNVTTAALSASWEASVAVYDNNKAFIRALASGKTYTFQSGDVYVRFAMDLMKLPSGYKTAFACYGDSLLPYEKYTENKPVDKLSDDLKSMSSIVDKNSASRIESIEKQNVIISSNIIDSRLVQKGYLIDAATGALSKADTDNYQVSDYIPIRGNNVVLACTSASFLPTIFTYDENKKYIRCNKENTKTLSYQEGDVFVRFAWDSDRLPISYPKAFACYGESLVEYDEYSTSEILAKMSLKKEFGVNLINPNDVQDGCIVSAATGLVESTDEVTYKVSGLIEILGTSIISAATTASFLPSIFTYDKDKRYLRCNAENSSSYTFKSDEVYCRVSWNSAKLKGDYKKGFANWGTELMSYEEYTEFDSLQKIDERVKRLESVSVENNSYYNYAVSKVICIGDSVTQGLITDYPDFVGTIQEKASYPSFLARVNAWEVTNAGRQGWSVRQWWNGGKSAIDTTKDEGFPCYNYADYQMAIIELGYNEGLTDTLDTDVPNGINYINYADTNTGRYCSIIEGLKNQNPNIFIVLVISSQMYTGGVNSNVIKKIGKKYSLPVIDLYTSPINLNDDSLHGLADGSSSSKDYTHFNAYGYFVKSKAINDALSKILSDENNRGKINKSMY